MNILRRICYPYKLGEVFTPNTIAKLAYVERKTLESDLNKYINLPGKQIFLYGHSGGGKTTIVRNQLLKNKFNFIKTHCESNTSFDELILQAFDKLDRFYVASKTSNRAYSIKADLKAEYGLIKAKVQEKSTIGVGEAYNRVVPFQLTPEKLAKFLGEINCIWIIEDFHKVKKAEKKRIADVIKIFIDAANDFPEIKIICIGAVGTARELVELDDNLANRVAELYVPLLTDKEIEELLNKGSSLLNVKMSPELKTKIVYYSNNLASLAHQICYDICYDKDVNKTKILNLDIRDDSFKVAVDSYVKKNSDTFAKLYESIVATDYGWPILKAFEHSEKEYISIGEIRHIVNSKNRNSKSKISEEILELKLEELGSPQFNELIRYDRNSKKYSITTPFFRAFLKMKMALEELELKERNTKKIKKKRKEYSIDSTSRLIIDDAFMENYYQLLDSYIIREQQFREQFPRNKK